MPLLSAMLSAMLSHIESTTLWFCSLFSWLDLALVYISPADLYFPCLTSCTLTPKRLRRSPRNTIWLETPVIGAVPPMCEVM